MSVACVRIYTVVLAVDVFVCAFHVRRCRNSGILELHRLLVLLVLILFIVTVVCSVLKRYATACRMRCRELKHFLLCVAVSA